MKQMDIEDLIKLNPNGMEKYLKDNISNIIYLSSYIEGNSLDMNVGKLLLDGRMLRSNHKFEDYIEMVNHRDAAIKLLEFGNRNLTSKDAIELRKVLFNNILGVYTENFRRFRNDAGYLITIPVEEIPSRIEKAISILNSKSRSNVQNFLNAIDFHTSFSPVHPFEDGVGRTTRLLTNLYLIKNGLVPVLLDVKDTKFYNSALTVFEFTGHSDAFDLTMLTLVTKDSVHKLLDKVSDITPSTLDALAVKSVLSQMLSKSNIGDVARVVPKFYKEGIKSDKGLAIMGLWMLSNSGLDSEVIKDALSHNDEGIRAMGVLAAKDSKNPTYTKAISDMALNDKAPKVRLLSIATLAEIKALNKDLISEISKKEKDEAVLTRFFKCMVNVSKKELDLDAIRIAATSSSSVQHKEACLRRFCCAC